MKKAFSRLALAIMVAFVMSLAVAIPAMAAPGEVTLTKEMNTPSGTTTPAFTFDFVLSQVAVVSQATTSAANTQWMPGSTFTNSVPATQAAPFPAGFTPATITMPANAASATTIVDFNDLIPTTTPVAWGFPNAGVFHFMVHEATGTNVVGAGSTLTYDTARYIISVEVINAPVTPTNPRGLAIRSTVVMSATAPAPAIPGVNWIAGDKTDPEWENTYVTTTVFQVNKVITGDMANMNDTFSITTTLTLPQQAFDSVPPQTAAPTVTVVWHADDPTATPPQAAGAAVVPAVPVTITGAGTAANPFVVTAELGHNQRLNFTNVVAGTTFTSTEIQLPDYVGTAVVTGPGSGTFTAGAGANVTVPGADTRYVSDTGNSGITFTNDFQDMILAGLVVGSMPFLAALLIATLLLAMMMASRSRKRIEQMPVAL
ncbi:MAG: hypothetical protein FWE48_03655 [Coriobacteriia bacterium]|nr:hypothetical protein [Coriobacteriia bacterium]